MSKTDVEAVLRISSTIVHECVHEMEREEKGHTEETGPMVEERKFMHWATTNLKTIMQKFPQLGQNTPQIMGINPN
jgi:hypothetical protein